ncbi:MAG: alpha/beta fold hydrolase [Anaerolineae bacterium]
MKRIFLGLLLGFTCCLSSIRAAAQETTPEPTAEPRPDISALFTEPGTFNIRQPIAGRDRTYAISLPAAYFAPDAASTFFPLLLVLHGATDTGEHWARVTNFTDLAEEAGFIVVYPDGLNGVWNDGRTGDPRIDPAIDDLSFLNGVIDTLIEGFRVDTTRIYVTGYSMGGFMAIRLACRLPDRIAAVAAVAAALPQYLVGECAGTTPMPFMLIHGTNDTTIPWIGLTTRDGSGFLSASETVNFFVQRDECAPSQSIQEAPDADPSDGTRVLISTYENCSGGAHVALVGVYLGGHTWPGHPFTSLGDPGVTSMDVDATRLVWAFLSAHHRE